MKIFYYRASDTVSLARRMRNMLLIDEVLCACPEIVCGCWKRTVEGQEIIHHRYENVHYAELDAKRLNTTLPGLRASRHDRHDV